MNTTRISYACALALAVACSTPGPASERELVVFGAASLHEAFDALGQELQATQHGVQVHATYAGSQALRAQIEQGARADIVAAAAAEELAPLVAAKRLGELKLLAHNELVIAKPKGAPAPDQLRDLATLARIVIGAPEVPVGRYAQRMLERANGRYGADFSQRVRGAVVSQEVSTRLVLAKVSLGEANAGIVYRTDARAAAKTVDTVEIPAELNERAEYVIAELRDSPHPTLARAFVELAVSPRGQAVLARFGFLPARDGSEPSRSIADERRLGADP